MFNPLDGKEMALRLPWFTRIVLRLFGRRFNTVASLIICRAYERRVINSEQMHAIAKHFDPTQRGLVGIAIAPINTQG